MKMVLIAHRGNISGRTHKENHPDQIMAAIIKGYDVEIDVNCIGGLFILGHDNPQYEIDVRFLTDNFINFWCHAKDVEALDELLKLNMHCFWHQEDDYTLTSMRHIWVYPGKKLVKGCIAVLPENASYSELDLSVCGGICSDFIQKWSSI